MVSEIAKNVGDKPVLFNYSDYMCAGWYNTRSTRDFGSDSVNVDGACGGVHVGVANTSLLSDILSDSKQHNKILLG